MDIIILAVVHIININVITFVIIVTIVVILAMFIQVSGHHLIVVNGDVAFDEVNEFLKDSGDIMPPSAVNSTRFYGNE